MADRKTVAVIPARGGSKGIPHKNVTPVLGKPLIALTIEAALKAKRVNRVIVTTDCPHVRTVTRAYSGVTAIDRPPELATDASLTVDAVLHAMAQIEALEASNTDIILLQPTSPLRTAEHIDAAYALYREKNAASVLSVTEETHSPFKNFTLTAQGALKPLFSQESLAKPRQELPQVMRQNGAIYILSLADLRREQSFYVEPALAFIMSEAESVDIDTPRDLEAISRHATVVA